jgi:hypothetical protein
VRTDLSSITRHGRLSRGAAGYQQDATREAEQDGIIGGATSGSMAHCIGSNGFRIRILSFARPSCRWSVERRNPIRTGSATRWLSFEHDLSEARSCGKISEMVEMSKKGITGHDEWVMTEALATAIVALEQLPPKHQPRAHMDDIRKLLAAGCQPGTLTLHIAQAKCRLFPDIDPLIIYREYGLEDGQS